MMDTDEDVVSMLLLLLAGISDDTTGPVDLHTIALVIKKKKQPRRSHLSMRKYDRKRRKQRKGLTTPIKSESVNKKRLFSQTAIPSGDEIFEVSWIDNLYYDCKVIDFIQINDRTYYDIQFIEDGVILENVDARYVYPARASRKMPKRGCVWLIKYKIKRHISTFFLNLLTIVYIQTHIKKGSLCDGRTIYLSILST